MIFFTPSNGQAGLKIYCEKKHLPKSFAPLPPGRPPDDRGPGFFLLAGF
jgi:hypothetical protein